MQRFLWKLFGFVVGAGLCVFLLGIIFVSFNMVPRGVGWIFAIISAGLLGARLMSSPRQAVDGVRDVGRPIAARWWGFDKGFRFSVFAAVLWVIGAHIWIDEYDQEFSNVYAPGLMLLVAYFGYLLFVKDRLVAPSGEKIVANCDVKEVNKEYGVLPDGKADDTDVLSDQTSAERERAMSELIRRMR